MPRSVWQGCSLGRGHMHAGVRCLLAVAVAAGAHPRRRVGVADACCLQSSPTLSSPNLHFCRSSLQCRCLAWQVQLHTARVILYTSTICVGNICRSFC